MATQFDFKITTWERVTVFDDEVAEKILQQIKDGNIECSDDIYNSSAVEETGDLETEMIFGVSEQMTLEENDGASTIEVLNDEGRTIYENGGKNFF